MLYGFGWNNLPFFVQTISVIRKKYSKKAYGCNVDPDKNNRNLCKYNILLYILKANTTLVEDKYFCFCDVQIFLNTSFVALPFLLLCVFLN